MKNILLFISILLLTACNNEVKIEEPKKKLGGFDMEALRYKDGYLTIKIKNPLKTAFAYASQPKLITEGSQIPYDAIRISLTDSCITKILIGSNLAVFQLVDGRDGTKLKFGESCYVQGFFKVY